MDVKGQVAVVTGAGSGLGRAAACALAERGARVVAVDRVAERVEKVAGEALGEVVPIAADVSDEQSVDRTFETIDEKFGTVHVCVNAAGIPDSGKVVAHGRALELSLFRRVLEVNLLGAFDVMRRCAERMVANEPDESGERGVVINVSSGAAFQGQRGQAAYSASKAGLIGMMLPAARDLADLGVRVVTIAPGLFDTGMVGDMPAKAVERMSTMMLNPKRKGDPREFAALVGHIVDNQYINATTLSIDAGMRLV